MDLNVLLLWLHPHVTPSPIHSRFASQFSSLCPILRYTSQQCSLLLSCPSLAAHPVSTQSQAKRTFPSWHLNQHIRANSHIYQICQLTNGREGEQREIHIKRLRFQFEIHSTSESSRRHIYKNHSSRHQERVTSSSIIKDWTDHCNKKGQYVPNTSRRTASSVLEGVICQRQQKGVGLWATVQEGVTSSDTQHHDTE